MIKEIGWNIINGILITLYSDSGFRGMFPWDSNGADLSLAVFGTLSGAAIIVLVSLMVAIHSKEPTRSVVRRLSAIGFAGGAMLYVLTYFNAGDGLFLAFILAYLIALVGLVAHIRVKMEDLWTGKILFVCVYFVAAMISLGFLGGVAAQSWLSMSFWN
ncbi:MAG: hypothetical protein IJQ34_01900 [Kiritimatiellae bacterium]|nr:hypothetical protein [Kiritimatiellia bacterium]MBR0196686.1 hypothetical protein [Kiritimatiellia bacterium]MBR0196865.1 hypothetical protein [Kiritimatiellia bacterium]